MDSTYYLDRKEKYWKSFGPLFKSAAKVLPGYMEDIVPKRVEEETKDEFESLLAKMPYLGGDENILTGSIVSGTLALAYCRVLERYGLSVEMIGVLINKIYADVFASLPSIVKWYLRQTEFSSRHQEKLKVFAVESQKRLYPGNYVMTYIEGDGEGFDFACHYSECAVLNFYREMGAEAYMPYVCVTDLTMSHSLRTGLHRTMNLYFGGECCDFQYKKNRPSLPGIPLEDLPEYQNRKIA